MCKDYEYHIRILKPYCVGAGEMAQPLSRPIALVEVQGSIPGTHMAALVPGDQMLF